MSDWAFQSASKLTQAIKEKKINATELLQIFIDRIKRLNPHINAIITNNYDAALKKAHQADEAIKKGENWGPLHGLPITIKDNLEVVGMTCSAGASDLKGHQPKRNADLVQSLLNAGAIIFGKTNMPKYGEDFQTYNDLHGQTNNPWNLSRSPGGSSGGSAAALASGLTGLEIGNDIGGSIRTPASFCGIYGHKPSYGIVPDRGKIPPPPGLFTGDYTVEPDIVVNGPMARSPQDLALALELIVKPATSDKIAWSIKLPPSRKKKINDFKIGVWLDDPICPVDINISDRIRKVADALSNAGAKIEEQHPQVSFERSFEVFTSLLNGVMGAAAPKKKFKTWIENEGNMAPDSPDYQVKQIKGAIQRHRCWLSTDAERQMMRQKWADFFVDFDVLLCPTAPVTAIPHDHSSWFKRTIEVNSKAYPYSNLMGWAGLTNIVFLPATVTPVGLAPNGLPIGVQIVGPYLEDHTPIQLAIAMEDIVGGFTPPPGVL